MTGPEATVSGYCAGDLSTAVPIRCIVPMEELVKGVGVALSGGGHRASLFGLGVLLYLGDARKLPELTSIASVSGGSLTNGYVAQTLDMTTVIDGGAFEEAVKPFARQLAQRG